MCCKAIESYLEVAKPWRTLADKHNYCLVPLNYIRRLHSCRMDKNSLG